MVEFDHIFLHIADDGIVHPHIGDIGLQIRQDSSLATGDKAASSRGEEYGFPSCPPEPADAVGAAA
ncbi:hypothetical protein [Sphingobium yanoikuyae]|uniref:hypothetical protein n=1 Tax=Sphingobium yanoikuyae TaxID=13690 RepID=UPI00138E4179|nr:hypothetical protein [Sphingobium yanoikuyae]